MQKMMTVKEVAGLMGCSIRTVWSLADTGRMPAPVRVRRIVRWRSDEVQEWIAAGCPDCREAANGGAR